MATNLPQHMKKTLPETTSHANRLPRASWPPPGVHFCVFWVPFWRPRLPRVSPEGPGSPPPGGQNYYTPRARGPSGGPGAPRDAPGGIWEAIWLQFWSLRERFSALFPSPNASRKLLRDPFLFNPLRRQQSATKDNATQHEIQGTGEVFPGRVGEG